MRQPIPGAIDSDVHPYLPNGLSDLVPYLDEYWTRRLGLVPAPAGGSATPPMQLPATTYLNPGGGLRGDARTPTGGRPASDPAFTVTDLIERFELGGAVLLGGDVFGLGGIPHPETASVIAAAYNDWLAETWLAADARYLGTVTVAPQDPTGAAAEIARWAGHPRMIQVALPNSDKRLGKRDLWPIYEVAEAHGFAIAVHPGGSAAGTNPHGTALDSPTTYIEYHCSIPQMFQAHLISMVLEGVFVQFPRLRVTLLEGGFAWMPHVQWRLDKNWKGLREEVPWLERPPSEYIREHVMLTTQPIYEPARRGDLLRAIELAQVDGMLMFSTDYPHWDYDDPVAALRGFDDALLRSIMIDNPYRHYPRLTRDDPAPTAADAAPSG
jgi:predicted TIM-barrel fold metal-dependent hydrolase